MFKELADLQLPCYGFYFLASASSVCLLKGLLSFLSFLLFCVCVSLFLFIILLFCLLWTSRGGTCLSCHCPSQGSWLRGSGFRCWLMFWARVPAMFMSGGSLFFHICCGCSLVWDFFLGCSLFVRFLFSVWFDLVGSGSLLGSGTLGGGFLVDYRLSLGSGVFVRGSWLGFMF